MQLINNIKELINYLISIKNSRKIVKNNICSNNKKLLNTKKCYKKLAMFGRGGKTSLYCKIRDNKFDNDILLTVGVNFWDIIINNINYEIWDTSGLKRFGNDSIIENKDFIIIMFDVTDIESINSILYWYDRIREIDINVPIAICGNKVDNYERIDKKIILNINRCKYFEISVKYDDNFSQIFNYFESFIDKNDNSEEKHNKEIQENNKKNCVRITNYNNLYEYLYDAIPTYFGYN